MIKAHIQLTQSIADLYTYYNCMYCKIREIVSYQPLLSKKLIFLNVILVWCVHLKQKYLK